MDNRNQSNSEGAPYRGENMLATAASLRSETVHTAYYQACVRTSTLKPL